MHNASLRTQLATTRAYLAALAAPEAADAPPAPAAEPTAAQRLERVGRECYGPAWREPMAAALGVSRVMIARWVSGASTPPADIDSSLGRVIHSRLLRLAAFRDSVSQQGDVEYVLDDARILGEI